jgi:hypothetical protein
VDVFESADNLPDYHTKGGLVQGCPNFGGEDFDGPKSLVEPEPPPTKNHLPFMWPLASEEFVKVAQERDDFGFRKYKTRLQPFNGRDALVDGFQEVTDAIVYLYQKRYEEQFTKPVVEAAIKFVNLSLQSGSDEGDPNVDEAFVELCEVVKDLQDQMGE